MGDPRSNSRSLGVIIVAAGSSARMGGGDKQFADLNGEPVLGYSLRVFARCRHVAGIALVLSSDNLDRGRRLVSDAGLDDLVICVQGGERGDRTRPVSVWGHSSLQWPKRSSLRSMTAHARSSMIR